MHSSFLKHAVADIKVEEAILFLLKFNVPVPYSHYWHGEHFNCSRKIKETVHSKVRFSVQSTST